MRFCRSNARTCAPAYLAGVTPNGSGLPAYSSTLSSPCERLQHIDQLAVRGAGRVVELADRMSVHQPAEPQQLAHPLAPIELQLGRAGGKEQPPQLAGAEELAEFRHRHIDQEQDKDPQGDGGKALPREGRDQIRYEIARRIALDHEVHETLEEARKKHDDPVEDGLEQDRLDQRRSIIASQQRDLVSDQHRLADNESRHRGEHEIGEPDQILRDEEIARQHDKVKADKKEDRRRQRLTHLVQKPSADPTGDLGSSAGSLVGGVERPSAIIIQGGLGPHDDPHWLAGMVTTGAAPFTPVSAIENSSMMTANVYLDWMSVSAIQNHFPSYSAAT